MQEIRPLEFVDPLVRVVSQAYREIILEKPKLTEFDENNELNFQRMMFAGGQTRELRNETEGHLFQVGKCIGYIGQERLRELGGIKEILQRKRIIYLERTFDPKLPKRIKDGEPPETTIEYQNLERVALAYIAASLLERNYKTSDSYPKPKFIPYATNIIGREHVGIVILFDASEQFAEQSAKELIRIAKELDKLIPEA